MIKSIKRLHDDERGISTLETVALLAIAAIVLAVIKFFWSDLKKWFDTERKEVIDTEKWDHGKAT